MATQLSRETHDRLRDELEDLVVRGRVEIAKRIEEARALGDLKENGEYHAAKDEQGKMELRIRQLKAMLEDVAIIQATSASTVEVGATVTLDFGGGDTERYLVGNIEERKEGIEIVSPDAPLGKALLGRSVGDDVGYEVNGRTLAVKLVGID